MNPDHGELCGPVVKLELQAQVETYERCVCSCSLARSSIDLKTIQQVAARQRDADSSSGHGTAGSSGGKEPRR